MSWVRPERIGPTGFADAEWNTAAKRVPYSTTSSNTRSAELSPLCGRARMLLSILTTSAARSGAVWPYSSGTPVSGMRGMIASVVVVAAAVVVGASVVSGTVVVVDARVVVGASVVSGTVGGGVVGAASLSPPHAAAVAARPPASSREASARLGGGRDVVGYEWGS